MKKNFTPEQLYEIRNAIKSQRINDLPPAAATLILFLIEDLLNKPA